MCKAARASKPLFFAIFAVVSLRPLRVRALEPFTAKHAKEFANGRPEIQIQKCPGSRNLTYPPQSDHAFASMDERRFFRQSTRNKVCFLCDSVSLW